MSGYLGSKAAEGAYQAIIARMPPHDTYIETHLGSGVVMRKKAPAARTIGIEIDPKTLADYPPPGGVEVHNGDCLTFLRAFDWQSAGRVVLYADPPYLKNTRTHPDSVYRYEYTDADHAELLAFLKALPANVAVMISGYPSDFYDVELAGWNVYEFQAPTRGGVRTEKIWMNFEPGRTHWVEYTGNDFLDRQRTRRLADRWAKKYAAMQEGDRQAILAALLEVGRTVPAPRYEVGLNRAAGTAAGKRSYQRKRILVEPSPGA